MPEGSFRQVHQVHEKALGHILRAFAVIGEVQAAEQVFATLVVKPYVANLFTRGRIDGGGSRGSCAGPLADDGGGQRGRGRRGQRRVGGGGRGGLCLLVCAWLGYCLVSGVWLIWGRELRRRR